MQRGRITELHRRDVHGGVSARVTHIGLALLTDAIYLVSLFSFMRRKKYHN